MDINHAPASCCLRRRSQQRARRHRGTTRIIHTSPKQSRSTTQAKLAPGAYCRRSTPPSKRTIVEGHRRQTTANDDQHQHGSGFCPCPLHKAQGRLRSAPSPVDGGPKQGQYPLFLQPSLQRETAPRHGRFLVSQAGAFQRRDEAVTDMFRVCCECRNANRPGVTACPICNRHTKCPYCYVYPRRR